MLSPEEQKARRRASVKKYRLAHPERVKAYRKKRWLAYRDSDSYRHNKRAYALRRYGITPDQFDAMLSSQGGRCAICRKQPRGDWRNNKFLHVDHNHTTGRVRGLLCPECNTSIGKMNDSPEQLRRAAAYLEDRMYI